jgi:hypothetical protein
MIDPGIFLLVLGLASVGYGGWLVFTAPARERQQARNVELRAAARGDLTPPDRWVTATGFRLLGSLAVVCGALLALTGQL